MIARLAVVPLLFYAWAAFGSVRVVSPSSGGSTLTVEPGLRVSSVSILPAFWPYGYLDHRFRLENISGRRLTVTLNLPARSYGGGLESLSRTLVIDPGASVHASLPQPFVRLGGDSQLEVAIRGGETKSARLHSLPDISSYYNRDQPYGLLVSRALSAETLTTLFNTNTTTITSSSSPHSYGSPEKNRFTRPEYEVEAWSPDWRAYTPYAGIFLAGTEWPRVPAEVREALFNYVRAGGNLLFAGKPDPAQPLPVREAVSPEAPGRRLGALSLGLGSVTFLPEPDPKAWPPSHYVLLDMMFKASAAPWREKPDFDDAHRACPVVTGLRVPSRTFFLTLLAFTLLAGPGVLVYTRRRNNRLLRFVLIPALSLVTTVGILAFAFLEEGVTPLVRMESVTWLDPVTQRAVTLGSVGAYACFTPSGGLRFDAETEVMPLGDYDSYSSPRCTLDWSRDQRFESGWLRPRVPAYFHVRRSEKRPERLLVAPAPGGGLEAFNALGGAIRSLTLQTPEGLFLRAGPIRAGGRAQLEPVPPAAIPRGPAAGVLLAQSLARRKDNWNLDSHWFNTTNRPPVPEPGRFIALLDACPFLENPITARATVQARAVVVGSFLVEPAAGVPAEGGRP